ncbi:MAG: cyclic pyranopterin monophosphate synthase MoaC [Magnetovibrio sp.]|nr:cyclic pyranopterin monophosphate synthase MoaC [Magnetovibrio sp.]|tara:strand:+ start:159 stop:635 length:477 start_codon:yes stop_codon:yes gene_type:complete
MVELKHIDENGNAIMVDISSKNKTERTATAKGCIEVHADTIALIEGGGVKKGDVLSVAQLAGIMGAKRTSELIPLCHQLNLSSVKVNLSCDPDRSVVDIEAICKICGQTGVEMEALTAVCITALTIYDMCKAVDKGMNINNIRLTHKAGGNSGVFEAE